MKLFIVDLAYLDNEGLVKDTWVLACKDNDDLQRVMGLNVNKFKESGYKHVSYSFRKVEKTDNNYKVIIEEE